MSLNIIRTMYYVKCHFVKLTLIMSIQLARPYSHENVAHSNCQAPNNSGDRNAFKRKEKVTWVDIFFMRILK